MVASVALTAAGEQAGQGTSSAQVETLLSDPELAGDIQVTPEELAAWAEATATPEQRAEIVADLQAAFAGVAQVGTGTRRAAAQESSIGEMELILAYGVNSTHWITASYADMSRGAIWVAVRACIARGIPSRLCNTAGNQLSNWAQGWGAASNHGVWAAIYWAPPCLTGDRW